MKFKIVNCGIVAPRLLWLALFCSALFCSTPVFAEKKAPVSKNDSAVLAEFKRCSVPAASLPKDCDDTRKQIVRINAVVKLYQKGNKAVLKDLIAGAIDSDSYLGETYGAFFATVVVKEPKEFLQAVSARSQSDRETLYRITALSLSDGQVTKVTKNLKQIAAQKTDKMSSFAQEFLTEIQNSR